MDTPLNTPDPAATDDPETAAKRAAIREGLADIAAGRVVPHEEVRRWVLSWDTENELPMPSPPCG